MKILDRLRKEAKTEAQNIAIDNCIFVGRVGAHLYGTNTKDSDEDFFGIFIEPEEYVLGRKSLDTVEFKTNPSDSGHRNNPGDLDVTMHSLRKEITLLEGNNPNQLEILFINKENILYQTKYFDKLVKNRNLFVSKKARHSFFGYAYSQLRLSQVKSGNQTGRKDLIAKFGFDPKLLSHAFRLYTECVDILVGHEIKFPLYNNKEILDIKAGLVPEEKFKERCKYYEGLIEQANITSTLQYSPDKEAIHKLQVELYKEYYAK